MAMRTSLLGGFSHRLAGAPKEIPQPLAPLRIVRYHARREREDVMASRESGAAASLVRFFDRLVRRSFATLATEFASALSYLRRVYLRPADAPPAFQAALRLITRW